MVAYKYGYFFVPDADIIGQTGSFTRAWKTCIEAALVGQNIRENLPV
jgi:hypothetical protein